MRFCISKLFDVPLVTNAVVFIIFSYLKYLLSNKQLL